MDDIFKVCRLFLVLFFTSCSTSFYIVRHAEKAVNTMIGDVSLSGEGNKEL